MMGLPAGWVSGVEMARTHKLKLLGNGVVPQQAAVAYLTLLGVLDES
jgi:DNA (cytosine-5)-methyltransferase 1